MEEKTMSETISEMILPGTYIDVRAEGLIAVGGISTGNVGIVGTSNKGPVGTAVLLGTYTEAIATFGAYDRWSAASGATPLTLTRALEQVFAGGASSVYAVRIANGTPASATYTVTTGGATPATLLTLTATSPGTWANGVTSTFDASSTPTTLTLTNSGVKEQYIVSTASQLAADINAGSNFFTSSAVTSGNGASVPGAVNKASDGGPDGASAGASDAATGLAILASQPVNIVCVAGLSANDVSAQILKHVEQTENDGNERIAVIGGSTDDPATLLSTDGPKVSSARVVLVAPGILAEDTARTEANKTVKLPASYAAAVVAGTLSTLAPQESLTNQEVSVEDLTTHYTRAQQKQLLGGNILVLQQNLGFRALKGITTDSGAFRQISVRRIVDYAKAGVRVGANPYIGKLNNDRVRAALKATLDGFLSGMVLDEMLVQYTLDVSATRAQQIAGTCLVTMTLQPTFSIDFVKVIMNLG
jgi:Phage tail sheath protein subtilisin-like domain/Phage tail sheath C-terminal domain